VFPDKVILASNSPRRLELLGAAFNNVEKINSKAEEPTWHKGESARDYLKRCVEVKAQGARDAFEEQIKSSTYASGWNLLVVADTIVVLGERLFGKPESPQGAFDMLSTLMGKTHEVQTAFALDLYRSEKRVDSFNEILITRVTFAKPTPQELWNYVKTGEPMDKSGSYGVQGPALQFVKKIEGSYLSVMGLPIARISEQLKSWQKKHLKS